MTDSKPSAEERANLDALGAQMRAQAPSLSPIELDQLKRRVLAAGRKRPARSPRRPLRLAALFSVTVGVLMGATGVTFGINAIAEKGDAAGEQYPVPSPPPTQPIPGPDVPDSPDSRSPGSELHGTLSEREFDQTVQAGNDAVPPADPVKAGRQITAGEGSLAFTGYLALPALAIGLFLVAAGVAVLRRSRRVTTGP